MNEQKEHWTENKKMTKYYSELISHLLKKYVYGITIQENKIYSLVENSETERVLKLIKNNSITKGTGLIDIFAVDTNNTKRFNITYVIWNYEASIRYLIRTHITQWTPVKSINNLYASAS